jgi:hypothetical protein
MVKEGVFISLKGRNARSPQNESEYGKTKVSMANL